MPLFIVRIDCKFGMFGKLYDAMEIKVASVHVSSEKFVGSLVFLIESLSSSTHL